MNKLLIDRVVYCLRKWKFFVDHFKPRPAKKQTPNHKDKAGKVTCHKAKSVQHKQASSKDESKLFMETEMHNVLIHQQKFPFLTRELRACARASYRYDVGNDIRSLARSIGRFL